MTEWIRQRLFEVANFMVGAGIDSASVNSGEDANG